jgi:hypothetical protein
VNREMVTKIANSVLHEGYMLYPYRPSAIKNRQRWTFGILYPPAYGEVASGTERSAMHSECLLQQKGDAAVQIQLRFLHLEQRRIGRLREGGLEIAQSISVDGNLVETWDEGVERSIEFEVALDGSQRLFQFSFPGTGKSESLRDSERDIAGVISRTQHGVTGTVSALSENLREGVFKLTVDIANTTMLPFDAHDRESAVLRSLLSAHTILTATGAEFVSLLDPPADLAGLVNQCKSVGNFPVLVGEQNEREMMLCSPIVLYDYPQIAPESAGDFYDATEMDEMLTLRVLTLTDEEKKEMCLADDRARKLLERTEESAREQLMRMHGVIRSLRPVIEKP